MKNKRMDPNFVSNQKWELQYVAKKFGVSIEDVKEAKRVMGKSRRKIYSYFRFTK